MKKIIMEAEIKVLSPLNVEQFDIGGFEFKINENLVPFDFNASGYQIKKKENSIIIEFATGNGPFFKELDIDQDCYEEVYKKLGLSNSDITAEFLSKVDKITEFYFSAVDYEGESIFVLNSILFYNEENETFKVKQEVIDNFNKRDSN